ncbi:type I restriction enzyme S subunit [Staphylococcus hominis]|uniref:restriction endonuclease subunit S n=1 Tax=Staphylococcus hominis TaxID=1290 RepID=UPI000660714E|nr:restriction endonuclease subunit S [Staphylococcus hominis]MBB4833628.1 type I restriction enzyme S subunit [Staphylococcus hominis]MCI2931567.1 restriction endonuclease subunit S [Staphylococcus hominis]SEM19216.1 type I restriction enzyme, S subunit [Staphylococcus hominis]
MEYKISDLCDIRRGASPRPIKNYIVDSYDNSLPWVKIADATKDSSRYIYDTKERVSLEGSKKSVEVLPGDLILSNSATPGLPKFMKVKACIHDGWLLLRNFKNVRKEFLYYILLLNRQKLLQLSNGSVFNNLKTDIVKNYIVDIPSIKKQDKILKIIGNIEDKLDTNNKLIANLEELSQTLFKRWFVDFEFPDENGNPYKSSGGKMIDSELGKIPNDWKISNFQEITAFNTEIIDTNQLENPLNYIGLEHISRNNIISIDRWENTSKVTGKKLKVCKGDILFGKLRPYFQKVGISPIDGVVSTDIMIFTPSFKNVYYFILLYLSQKNFIRYITSTSTGTRMPRTGKKQINSYKIVLPTNLILTSFNTILNRYTDLIKLLINENAKLIQLRDTLLPKLMSGEIEIPDDIEVNNDELSI